MVQQTLFNGDEEVEPSDRASLTVAIVCGRCTQPGDTNRGCPVGQRAGGGLAEKKAMVPTGTPNIPVMRADTKPTSCMSVNNADPGCVDIPAAHRSLLMDKDNEYDDAMPFHVERHC